MRIDEVIERPDGTVQVLYSPVDDTQSPVYGTAMNFKSMDHLNEQIDDWEAKTNNQFFAAMGQWREKDPTFTEKPHILTKQTKR